MLSFDSVVNGMHLHAFSVKLTTKITLAYKCEHIYGQLGVKCIAHNYIQKLESNLQSSNCKTTSLPTEITLRLIEAESIYYLGDFCYQSKRCWMQMQI